ncbi:MAG TPA: hypothetical protein VGN83_06120 [Falsiroseomonas sp.]|nr:hypothetical protein [Falsiroseomonas sp.]
MTLDTAGALAVARELGAAGWATAELLLAIRIGMAEGSAARREGGTT